MEPHRSNRQRRRPRLLCEWHESERGPQRHLQGRPAAFSIGRRRDFLPADRATTAEKMNRDDRSRTFTRREILQLSAKAALAGALAPHISVAGEATKPGIRGALVGDLIAAKA